MPGAAASAPVIRVDNVSKRYGRTLALDEVSFEVRDRELFALLGPNGAGKTTLLHILCTILRPDSGVAMIGGFDVVRQPLAARRRLGIVFQEPSLDDRLTVEENLNLHGLVYGVPRKLRRQRIEEMLALVELTEWANKPAQTLSSGMKRRLEIARALIHDSDYAARRTDGRARRPDPRPALVLCPPPARRTADHRAGDHALHRGSRA